VHTLRPYQRAAVDAVLDFLETDSGSPLVDMATGTGKSLVLAELCKAVVRSYDKKIVVVTHVKELIEQNYKEFLANWWRGADYAGIHSAGFGKTARATRQQIIFAGIQTAHRNAAAFGSVDLLLIDEAHLVPRKASTMYGRFIAELRLANPDMRVAGLTATPYRLGSGRLDKGDGAMFDRIVYTYGISDGVRDGYLARLVTKATETGFDLTGVGKSGGEYIEKQLQAAVDKTETTRRAIDEAVAYGRDRKSWLAFCSGVEHAYHVRDEIRLRQFVAETITGATPSEERRRILEDFKAGHIRCVTNANVLTTGFNAPGVDMIMALRPTASASLYVQMMGRGTRNAPGKDNCLVLDFAGLIRTHGPVDCVKPPGEKTGGGVAPVKECPTCHSLIHASIMECPDCGHVFTPSAVSKLTAKASAMAIMGNAPAEWVRVSERTFAMHYKPERPTSVLAKFRCGIVTHKAWYSPEHTDFRGKIADKFWLAHGGQMPLPRTAVSWMSRAAELRPTTEIAVKPKDKWINVVDARPAALAVAAE
jgi:DNA repair protein RadD